MTTNRNINFKPPSPPECVESENIVLAGLLHDEELRKMFEDMGGGVELFHSPFNQEICQSIEKQNGCLEILDIKNDLSLNHTTDAPVRKLMELGKIWCEEFAIPAQEIPLHIKILKQFRNKRKLYDKCCEGMIKVFSPNGEWLENDDWKDPTPFEDYSGLPTFPTESLGGLGFEIVESIAKVNQVDTGLPASMYLSALSTCLSKKFSIDLKTHTEPVNIFTCPCLDSGERKTTTMRTMMKPIFDYQADVQKRKSEDESKPYFICDDITTESLFDLMADNAERMSVVSAEGGIFSIMAGRYNSRGHSNFDLYLKGHAGDPCSTHRKQQKARFMQAPALTMCLAVQRDVVNEMGSNQQFRGRGLCGRFLYSLCKPQAGYRTRQLNAIPQVTLDAYEKHIIELMNTPSYGDSAIGMAQEAQALWDSFYDETESDMKQGGKLYTLKDWGSKLAGAVARISGLLHFAELGKDAIHRQISADTVSATIDIGRYYKQHALAVFGLMGDNPQVQSQQS